MENILLNFTYETKTRGESEYLLFYNSKYYQVGKTIFDILKCGQRSSTIEELSNNMETKKYSAQQICEIIKNHILPILNKDNSEKAELPFIQNYWWRGQLLSPKYTTLFAKPFKVLFGKRFPVIFPVLALTNIIAYNFFYAPKAAEPSSELFQLVIVYFLLFIILLIHEIGHVAASRKENLKPQGIGFGLYFFMPMMYVNLTDAWALSKYARTKINLAGITTQMIINIILFIVLCFSENAFLTGTINKLFVTNTLIIILNLVPFFKFDGYWILSDVFTIPNLLQESNNTFLSFFIKKSPFKHDNILTKSSFQKRFLLWFTLLRLVFIAMVILTVIMFVIHSIFKSSFFFMSIPYMEFNLDNAVVILKNFFMLAIAFIIVKKYSSSIIRFIQSKISK